MGGASDGQCVRHRADWPLGPGVVLGVGVGGSSFPKEKAFRLLLTRSRRGVSNHGALPGEISDHLTQSRLLRADAFLGEGGGGGGGSFPATLD